MVVSLQEGKARLPELVERASKGEEILITVNGKAVARIGAAVPPVTHTEDWIAHRRAEARKHTLKVANTPQEFWDALRQDRL